MSNEKSSPISFAKLPRPLLYFVAFAVLVAALMLFGYVAKFGGTLSPYQADWGTFGDFMGGILNPLFAFAALLALLCAIAMQQAELSATKKALDQSAAAMNEQQKVLQIQTFDATFFKLLDRLEAHLDLLSERRRPMERLLGVFFSKEENQGLFIRYQGMPDLSGAIHEFRNAYGGFFNPNTARATRGVVTQVLLLTQQIQEQSRITPERLPLYLAGC